MAIPRLLDSSVENPMKELVKSVGYPHEKLQKERWTTTHVNTLKSSLTRQFMANQFTHGNLTVCNIQEFSN